MNTFRSAALPFFTIATGLIAGLIAGLTTGCSANRADGSAAVKPTTAMVASWLSGSYSSAEQAAADKDFFDIRLQIVPIWPERADGPWLYVEQATAAALDKPYRQRVYRIVQTDSNRFRSDVYTLPAPELQYAGAWQNASLLANLTPEQLALKDGCSVNLTYHKCSAFFDGGTTGTGCESTLRGAAYATSEVTMWSDVLISWDRGYDQSGKQVWGAEKGGYRFKKDGASSTVRSVGY